MEPASLAIFVAHYARFWTLDTDVYVPLQAGRSVLGRSLDMGGDDTGDNISGKNGSLSEFTGLYWIWKNTHTDIVGWCHYRRYFRFREHPAMRLAAALFSREGRIPRFLYKVFRNAYNHPRHVRRLDGAFLRRSGANDPGMIRDTMDGCDMIVPVRLPFQRTIADHYRHFHRPQDWETMLETLREMRPEDAGRAEEFFDRSFHFRSSCLFVMRRPVFEEFMRWIFPVLFELDRRLPASSCAYQGRAVAFLGERLFNFYIEKARDELGLRIKELEFDELRLPDDQADGRLILKATPPSARP